ncbi:MAG: cysteine-rich CWC family protein [Burkholderiaceae bacterium]|nr:cysteine-rich CWC family protein [Burkholderiaceae bacterium]
MNGVNTNTLCPRCGQAFRCGATASRCDCFDLQLSEELRTRLVQQYEHCLCLTCLRQLQAQETSAPGDPAKA